MDAQVRRKPLADQIFGDNKAPLAEVLAADHADLRREVTAYVAKMKAANRTPKTDEEQAALGQVILDGRALWKKADGARTTDKEPILNAGRELDAWFKGLLADLVAEGEALQAQADTYARQKAAEERARKLREAEELRRKEAEARAKEEAARTAAGAARAGAQAETVSARAEQAEAAAAASDAELVKARVGGVTTSAKGAWVATITDYQAAIGPLGAVGMFIKREALEAAFNAMAKTQKGGAAWPGVQFRQDTKATFR